MLEPLTDLYVADGPVYLWLKLLPGYRDLDLHECGEDEAGAKPEWLKEEIGQSGVEGIIRNEWKLAGHSWAYWGLTEGIAPGQPFCVEIHPPHWYRCSYEYDEWDIEWTWDLVQVLPRTPEKAAKSWQQYWDAERRYEKKRARIKERLEQKRQHDPSALYLRWSPYYGGGGYDDMRVPHGVRVHLCTKHERQADVNLGSDLGPWGEDNNGSHEVALQKLIEGAAVKYPHLDEAFIRKLLRRW